MKSSEGSSRGTAQSGNSSWSLPEPWSYNALSSSNSASPSPPHSYQPSRNGAASTRCAKRPSGVSSSSVNHQYDRSFSAGPSGQQPPSYSPQQRRSILGKPQGASGMSNRPNVSAPARPTSRNSPVSIPPSIPPQRRTGISQDRYPGNTPPSIPPRMRSAHSNGQSSGLQPTHQHSPQATRHPIPQGPVHSPQPAIRPSHSTSRRRRRLFRVTTLVVLFFFVIAIIWPLYVIWSVNSKIQHVDALSSRAAGTGETWLIAGSDERTPGSAVVQDGTQGRRADSIMLVHKAANGQAAVVSLPRDSAVEIPGRGLNKINASFAFGGPKLLVETVENLTGLKVDHYMEVSMDGVTKVVDALDGVNLCYDGKVNDADSGMVWEPGCHDVNGQQALAYSRMRNQDPLGDIGRAQRQRNVIQAVVGKATSPSQMLWPSRQLSVGDAGAKALAADQYTGVVGIGRMLLAYRKASGENLTGAPPISSLNYTDGIHGSMVQLDPSKIDSFWTQLDNGTLTKESFGSLGS
ncbi:MAG: LCP family protein [Actinomycetaceae bacterium]|nr:LCP family protein [Actinomycetaceae bacterium]